MGASKVYAIQLYREEIGDIGERDLLIVDTQDVELTAKNALLGYFNNPTVSENQRPYFARLVANDEDAGAVTFKVIDPKTVEKI